ncbi:MAG: hypothetical protein OXF41_10960 [bacterium]|nr:hypothetical protein [bacterium]
MGRVVRFPPPEASGPGLGHPLRHVPSLAGAVADVFTARWDGCAAATWNTRRVAVQAFASWCQERWPLAADPLAEAARAAS